MAGKENRCTPVNGDHPVLRLAYPKNTPPKPHRWPPGSKAIRPVEKRRKVKWRNKITQDAYDATKRVSLVSNVPRISSTRVIDLPDGISDASMAHWPKALASHAGIPGKKGIFQIDDARANKKCTTMERQRRDVTMRRAFETLGNGLEAYRRAELRGESLQLKREDGASRSSHVATTVNGVDGYRVTHLPDGYAVFQSWRGDNSDSDEPVRAHYDTYICGSAHVKEFTSTREYIPHLHWLVMGRAKRCTCFRCSSWDAPASDGPTTPKPIASTVN
ncbi:hypothetical protein DL93DRAFT_2079831 [Clavulina sp. PMI_390]|nr:hypothetical protein DL93DRAFT_2079831 [Clavulina sp. PMI_390]